MTIGQFIKDNRFPTTPEPYEDYEKCTYLMEGECRGCTYSLCPMK